MPTEIQMLAWSIALGFVQLFAAAGFATAQRGLRWNAGPRDGQVPPLQGVAARMDRALRNFLETFPLFAAAVLAVVVTDRADAGTVLGAQLYFWARVAYVPLYALGVPYVRSLAWAVGFYGILQVLKGLF